MAQNRNGSEPFVVCGEKERKAMRGMELWGKAIGFGREWLVWKSSVAMIRIVSEGTSVL